MALFAILVVALLATASTVDWRFTDLWLTPAQQGQRLFEVGEYSAAADRFVDPLRRGVALYRAAEFEAAAAALGRASSAEATFNHGNALVMRGNYEDGIAAYDIALALRPEWESASVNREIARVRAERVKKEGGNQTGLADEVGADEITFEKGMKGGQEKTEEGASNELSYAEMRAIWLRRVRTKPGDFLRAKFAYQYSRREGTDE